MQNKDLVHIHPHDHKNRWDWRVIFQFLKHINLKSDFRILELGGGMGNVSYYYAIRGLKAVISDVNKEYIDHSVMRHENISGLLHDINQRLPFNDSTFDLVSCLGTLHYGYIKSPVDVLKEMKRVSREYVLFDLFSKKSLYYNVVERVRYPLSKPRRYYPEEVNKIIEEAGLRIINVTSTRNIPFLKNIFPYLGKSVIFLCSKKNI